MSTINNNIFEHLHHTYRSFKEALKTTEYAKVNFLTQNANSVLNQFFFENLKTTDEQFHYLKSNEENILKKSDELETMAHNFLNSPVFYSVLNSSIQMIKSLYIELFIDNYHPYIKEVSDIGSSYKGSFIKQLFSTRNFYEFFHRHIVNLRKEFNFVDNDDDHERDLYKNLIYKTSPEHYNMLLKLDFGSYEYFRQYFIIVFISYFIVETKKLIIRGDYLLSNNLDEKLEAFIPFFTQKFDLHFKEKDVINFVQQLKKMNELNNDLFGLKKIFFENDFSEKNPDFIYSLKNNECSQIYLATAERQKWFYSGLSKKTDFIKDLNKKIKWSYCEYFYNNLTFFDNMRKAKLYDFIGRETMKHISYLKTANAPLVINNHTLSAIEKKQDEFNTFIEESPELFYPSFARIGFHGLNQLQCFKNFLKLDVFSEDDDILFNYYKIKDSERFFPISKKGWKFLLKQNKNYLLRSIRFIRLGVFAYNLELSDAWLRSNSLRKLLNTSYIYSICYPIIQNSVSSYKGAVSQFSPFSENKHIRLDRMNGNCSKSTKKEYGLFLKQFLINHKNAEFVNQVEFFYLLTLLTSMFALQYRFRIDSSFVLQPQFLEKFHLLFYTRSIYNVRKKEYINENKKIDFDFESIYSELKSMDDFFIDGFRYSQYNLINPLVNNEENHRFLEFVYREIQPLLKKIVPDMINLLKKEEFVITERDFYLFKRDIYNITYRHYDTVLVEINDYLGFLYDGIQDQDLPHNEKLKILNKQINRTVKSFDQLLDLSDRWHNDVQENSVALNDNQVYDYSFLTNLDFPNIKKNKNSYFYHFNDQEVEFKLITNSIALFHEGKKMHHCVYSYSNRCKLKNYIVFHVPQCLDFTTSATLGISIKKHDDGFDCLVFNQMFSVQNAMVSDADKKIANSFIHELNKEIKADFYKRLDMKKIA